VQAVGDVHDTLKNPAPVVPGLGLVWRDQDVPFFERTSVWNFPLDVLYAPTALHWVLDTHDTDTRKLS
jgi:hypothetical protein